jgi:uncharacterized protein YllA (UPF0747 family)
VLSPNVLLRPVAERALVPTASYVAGPGELSYFAQVTAVAHALGVEPPIAVPRWSTTIIEPHVLRIMARLGLRPEELADPHRAEGRLARAAVPDALAEALARLRRELDRGVADIGRAAATGELALPNGVVDGVRRAIQHRIDRLDRRIVAAVKRREADSMWRIATARGALFPLGTRQERALNFIPILARHGASVVDRMIAGATEHARTLVGGEGASESAPAGAAEPLAAGMPIESPRVADA